MIHGVSQRASARPGGRLERRDLRRPHAGEPELRRHEEAVRGDEQERDGYLDEHGAASPAPTSGRRTRSSSRGPFNLRPPSPGGAAGNAPPGDDAFLLATLGALLE